MVWSSSPTRKTRFAGAASRRASRSWLRSTSWTSSTSRCAQRARQRASSAGVALERPERAGDEVVEVERAGRRERPLVGDEGARDGPGRRVARRPPRRVDAEVELQPREGVVEAPPGRRGSASGQHLAQQSDPRRHEVGVRPASRRISSPRAWNVRTRTAPGGDAERLERGVQPLAQLLGGARVEGDRGDRRRVGPVATSQATRATRVVVLPLPAGATQSTGPGGAVAAARWSGASRASRSATAADAGAAAEVARSAAHARSVVGGAFAASSPVRCTGAPRTSPRRRFGAGHRPRSGRLAVARVTAAR